MKERIEISLKCEVWRNSVYSLECEDFGYESRFFLFISSVDFSTRRPRRIRIFVEKELQK
jgi:hypothetical protein